MQEDRDKKLELARKLAALIDHPSTPEAERKNAQATLDKLVDEYEFIDEELHPVEPLEDEVPLEPGMTFDEVLKRLGITREQLNGFIGELVIRGLSKLGTSLVGAMFKGKK